MKTKILAVTLARSGSKGIKEKNITNLCGHPLISYTIYAAQKSKFISRYIVSTDSKKFKTICENYGAVVPFLRPKSLSEDHVWSRDALKHAVIKTEKFYKEKYDYIIELPATAPLRSFKNIDKALQKLKKKKSDSVIGVCRVFDKNPIRIKKISGGQLKDYNYSLREGESSRRQDLPPCYVRNGSIYAMKRDLIVKKFSRKGRKSLPLVMNDYESINIDEHTDLLLAETLVKKGYSKNFPASIFYERKIKFFGNGKKKVLVTYPYKIVEPVLRKMKLNKFKFIFCDQNNLKNINIKMKKQIVAWLTSTDGNLQIDNKIIMNFENLKYILSPSTGLTHINKQLDKKIKIFHLNKSMSKKIMASSEYAIGQIINLARNISLSQSVVKDGNWRNKQENLRGHELSYFNFGILGYGRIGKNIAKFFKSFGYKFSYYDPYVKDKKAKRFLNLKKFLKSINFLIISSKLNQENKNLLNYDKLKFLKRESIIFNVSRGEIIDEKDLKRLIKKKYFTVGLDVISNEHTLLDKKNHLIEFSRNNEKVIITPHIAGLTFESENKAITMMLNKLNNLKKI